MRKFIIAAGLMAVTVVASAQEALQCVNPDVLNSLLFNARAEAKLEVRRTMPDIIAGFRAPAGFQLIGSGVRGQGQATSVAYKTTLQDQAALDSLVGFLSQEGWRRENTQQSLPPGVIIAGPQPTAEMLCRNGERRNVRVQDIGGMRYATITGFRTSPPRACDAPQPQQDFLDPMASINARRANLPRLSFPDTARMSTTSAPNGINEQRTASSTVRIESPDSPASLVRLLSRQLVEQGWRSDAQWSGRISSGSTWTRRNADGQAMWGTLEILGVGAGTYDVGFTLAMQ